MNLIILDSFIVVDCGGGTVNLTSIELLENNKISEITESTSGNCGSSLIDKKFVEFLGRKLGSSIIESLEKDHYNVLQYMVQEFCKEVKIPFTGQKSEFQRYDIVLKNYPSIIEEAKKQGFLKESDSLWVEFNDVRGMFDPLIKKIIDLIKGQLAQQPNKECSAIMLVGGFSESKYLQDRIKKEFHNMVPNISVPSQPMIAVVKGGVQFGLRTETTVHRVLRRTYGILIF
jgi:molecular chaperone DnaK (HSP70)